MVIFATRPGRKGFWTWGHEHQYDRIYSVILRRRLARLFSSKEV